MLALLGLTLIMTGCSEKAPANQDNQNQQTGANVQIDNNLPPEQAENDDDAETKRILIAYFSATNTTEDIANHLQEILDADIYEITPAEPYTSEDLDYNSDCRANREQNDADSRPAIAGSVANMADYDVVFIGYPIWWGQAPKIISTFLESYDFSGKTIVPFCTSGSSGIGSSAANLHGLAEGANWLAGQRFAGNAGSTEISNWVNGLSLSQ